MSGNKETPLLFDPDRDASNRLDYHPHPYRIPTASLTFRLDKENTEVSSEITVERNPAVKDPRYIGGPLELDGKNLKLKTLRIRENDAFRTLPGGILHRQGKADDPAPPEGSFTLEIVTITNPTANTQMSGLYAAGKGILCTQCEARDSAASLSGLIARTT